MSGAQNYAPSNRTVPGLEVAAQQGALLENTARAVGNLENISYFLARASDPRRIGRNYWYVLDNGPVTLLPGTSIEAQIRIQANHDFRAFALMGTVYEIAGGGARTFIDAPDIEITIQEANSISLMNGAVHWNAIFNGNARRPGYLPLQHIFPRTQIIRHVLTNLSTTDTLEIRLAWQGTQIFDNTDLYDISAAGIQDPQNHNPMTPPYGTTSPSGTSFTDPPAPGNYHGPRPSV